MHAPLVTGPFLAATLLLGLAGVVKVARPGDTAGALRVAGLPARLGPVRAGAGVEVVVAVLALAGRGDAGAAGAGLVAAAYASFAAFVGVALVRHWPLASCGCFARPDTRPDLTHLGLNLAGAAAAASWVVADPGSVAVVWDGPGAAVAALVVATGAVTLLAYLVFTRPGLAAAGAELGPAGPA